MSEQQSAAAPHKNLRIGDVFTPLKWGEFAVETFGVYTRWLEGATIFDPTMGEGNLLEALITCGNSKGKTLEELPTNNLFGNELNEGYFAAALEKFEKKYGLDMRSNFTNCDLLHLEKRTYDIVIGNPPWQNYVDLPASYKQLVRPFFSSYGLAENPQHLLLGGSRIDLAALIVAISINDFLNENGEAIFFLPLSLFLNDGAHQSFRSYTIGPLQYALNCIYDFADHSLFAGVKTRYGLAHFTRNQRSTFPIPYFQLIEGCWEENIAKPMFQNNDPLSVFSKLDTTSKPFSTIVLPRKSTPRQGINTGGANDLFFFDHRTRVDSDHCLLSNKHHTEVLLPKDFVYPLISTSNFSGDQQASKWVLLPYNQSGKPLNWEQIKRYPVLSNYLLKHKDRLKNRKGVMLNSLISRGYWWALLGVGEYNFYPYKIVWEAYGKSTFNPTLFQQDWQANQALQAYIPMKTKKAAVAILAQLSSGELQDYLGSLCMQGTMNWAQPGKIKKFVRFED